MPVRVRVTVPSDERALPILGSVAQSVGTTLGLGRTAIAAIDSGVQAMARFVLAEAYPDDPSGEIETTFEAEDGAIRVTLHDWGEPVPSFRADTAPDTGDPRCPAALTDVAVLADDLRLVNLGAEGKRLTARFLAPEVSAAAPSAHAFGAPDRVAPPRAAASRDEIEIRAATEDDVAVISRLLYVNYGLSYGHPDFYRDDWFAEQLRTGRVVSTVAVHGREIVGHHALLLERDETAAETGVAVVHPAYRGLGVFGLLFARTLANARAGGLQAVFGRAVTVHAFSQRAERAQGYRETALLLGAVPATMSMRDISGAEAGRRSASLVGYLPVTDVPPRAVTLPARYAEPLRSAYERLGLPLAPPVPAGPVDGPTVVSRDEPQRATGVVHVGAWDAGTPVLLQRQIRDLMRRHEDVVFVDLDLHTLRAAELDEAIDALRARGFFYAGLMPFGSGGHDRLRLQRIQADNVELEAIVLDSDDARTLGAAVMADRAEVEGEL